LRVLRESSGQMSYSPLLSFAIVTPSGNWISNCMPVMSYLLARSTVKSNVLFAEPRIWLKLGIEISKFGMTVTLHVALKLLPSTVLAVIVVSPPERPITTPLFTVATPVLFDDQLRF